MRLCVSPAGGSFVRRSSSGYTSFGFVVSSFAIDEVVVGRSFG